MDHGQATRKKEEVVLVTPGPHGMFTPDQLAVIADIARDVGTRAELVLDLPLGILVPKDRQPAVCRRLAAAGLTVGAKGPSVRNFKCCPPCSHAQQDVRAHSEVLERAVAGLPAPQPLHISVCGCACSCGMAYLMDIGFIATPRGYTVYIGGSPYGKPVTGQELIEALPASEMATAVWRIVEVYATEARGGVEYLRTVLERIGLQPFRTALAPHTGADAAVAT